MTQQRDIYFSPAIPREWGDAVLAVPPARLVRRNLRHRVVLWFMVPVSILLLYWTPVLTADSHTAAGIVAAAVVCGGITWQVVVMLRAQPVKPLPLLFARTGYITGTDDALSGWALALDNIGG